MCVYNMPAEEADEGDVLDHVRVQRGWARRATARRQPAAHGIQSRGRSQAVDVGGVSARRPRRSAHSLATLDGGRRVAF